MYTLKGFGRIPAFTDNAVNAISEFGELSIKSRTYSFDQQQYRSSTYKNTVLEVFASKTDTNNVVAIPDTFTELVLEINEWLYNKCINGAITEDEMALRDETLSEFSGKITDLDMGAIVTNSTNQRFPSYISYSISGTDEENYIKIWYSDSAFYSQYDEFEMKFVRALDDLDLFHTKTYQELVPLLKAKGTVEVVAELSSIIQVNPASKERALEFTWVDPTDDSLTLVTTWAVAIYGQAGDNIDSIRRSITESVLAESTYTKSEWIAVLPDLFRPNEFIFVPQWDALSVPDESQVAGVFSSSLKLNNLSDKVYKFYPDYPPEHLNTMMYVSSMPYNYVMATVIGGPENKDGAYDFRKKFPDYFSVDPSENDFNRMGLNTQAFVTKLHALLKAAENATLFSQLPEGINRITRNDYIYVSQSHENVEYLVLSKQSYLGGLNE